MTTTTGYYCSDSSDDDDDDRRGTARGTTTDGETTTMMGGSALGVLGGPALDASLGGLGSSVMGSVGRRGVGAREEREKGADDGTTVKASDDNPFDVDEKELEARREPLGVGVGGEREGEEENGVAVAEAMREVDLDGRGDDARSPMRVGGEGLLNVAEEAASPATPRRETGGQLENGSYHAEATMSYGDLLAPPPSYADSVMYTQPEIQPVFDGTANAGGTTVFLDGHDEADSAGSLKIWVSDPKIEADGTATMPGKRVTHYKITTRTDISSYIHKEVIVWRRFRDFVALDARLSAVHRGYFIPPRPEKTVVNSTEDNFIQERAGQLQNYLNHLAAHPKLRLGDPLRIFLTHQDLGASLDWFNMTTRVIAPVPSSPETPQRPPIAVSSPNQGRDFGRFFKELRQTVVQSTAVSAVGGALGLDTPKPKVMEEDAAFMVEKDRVARIEQELSGMSSKATKLLTLQQKYGEAVGEFGMECLKFAKLQEEEGVRMGKYSEHGVGCMTAANEMRKAGNISVKVSQVSRSATSQTAQALQPLHDYLKIMPAVRKSINERNDSLLTLQTMLAEAERLDARIAKLEPDLTKMKKVQDLKLELDATRATGNQAKSDYDMIQERHREEFARLEKDRVTQFHAMLLNYARVQVANSERSLSLWRGLAEEFGASADEWRSTGPEKVLDSEFS